MFPTAFVLLVQPLPHQSKPLLGHHNQRPDPHKPQPAHSRRTPPPRMAPTNPVSPDRVRKLNAHSPAKTGTFVLYWLQNSVRTLHNPALEEAATLSTTLLVPLRACHILSATAADDRPLPERHAAFLLEGLVDVRAGLCARGVPFAVVAPGGDVVGAVSALACGAAAVVTDASYLRGGIEVRRRVADALPVPLFVVEGDVVVPVETVSDKAEHAARTIRPKIAKLLADYLRPLEEVALPYQKGDIVSCESVERWFESAREKDNGVQEFDLAQPELGLQAFPGLDRGSRRVSAFKGGQNEARRVLKLFLEEKLVRYGTGRNEPAKQLQSDLSPYLRAGNISPVDIALQTKAKTKGKKGAVKESEAAFLEELIIRRELAVNACWFNPVVYDVFEKIVPAFARVSLQLHKRDKRPKIYSYEELEAGVTSDTYWNAAQLEMVVRGKQHGYMRMYWAKQILGWVEDPAVAMDYALRLNNRWELDAVDPNSYAGVIWCFGLHDQGWRERPIWGKVRYMNEAGLKRKFNMAAYVALVDRMVSQEGLPTHIAELRKMHRVGGQLQKTVQETMKRSRSKPTTSGDGASRQALLKSIKRLKR